MEIEVPKIPDVPIPDTADFWERISNFEMPTQQQFVEQLTQAPAFPAVLLFVCGLVYMLQGWKIFKVLIVVNSALLGAFLGFQLAGMLKGQNMPTFGAIACALLFAILSWPLMKYALSIMGGLAGSFIGYGVWHYIANVIDKPHLGEYAWAGAIIGLITLGLLAFLVFKLVVMIFTSLQGSLMTVSGVLIILMKYDPIKEPLESTLIQNAHLLALLICVPALLGFGFQYAAVAKKASKKKKSSGAQPLG